MKEEDEEEETDDAKAAELQLNVVTNHMAQDLKRDVMTAGS